MAGANKRSSGAKAGGGAGQTIGETARDYARAVGGGLLIGLPLLFTMEMWWHGFLLPWWKILLLLAVSFLIVIGYSALSGFRRERSWLELGVDSVETIGIAIVIAAGMLLALGRIEIGVTPLPIVAGMVALESIPVAFGVAVAGTQLASPDDTKAEQSNQGSTAGDRSGVGAFGRLFVAAGGALLFSLNVAPTEEIIMLGTQLGPPLLLVLMLGTVAITFAIVFWSDFRGGRSLSSGDSPLDRPLTETLAAYAISLLVALLLLWSFGRTEGVALPVIAGQTIALAVLASFGAAVGRLLVGGGKAAGGRG